MATRVEKAIAELETAMGGRPWVLLFDPLHVASRNAGFVLHKANGMAPYTLLGFVGMFDRFVSEILDDTQSEARSGRRGAPDRRQLEISCLNQLGLIFDFTKNTAEELFDEIMEWNEGKLHAATEWGKRFNETPDQAGLQPDFFPSEWVRR